MDDLISMAAALDVLVTSPNFHTTLTRIEELPAVDAIPVEWLHKKIKEHTDDEGWQDYLANSFGLCIEEWQKEQVAKT